ncbi:MAG: hypothetical protein ACLFUI_01740 [Halanaerobiales bacterium]
MQIKTIKIFIALILILFISLPVLSADYEYTIDIDKTYQEIEGFGASIAWYDNWVTGHPNKEELYDIIFKELGTDILRLQNWHGKNKEVGEHTEEIVEEAEKSLGHPVKILMTSWAPPRSLKSNDDLAHGGTLIKEDGEYAYDKFAEYWHNSLRAYEGVGIVPDYISIQNEPDYEAEWNSCLFEPTETDEIAGYDKALEAVYKKLHNEMDNPPMLIGPETIGIGNNSVESYLNELDMDYLDAIAHHLYNGGDHQNPTSFSHGMNQLAEYQKEKPIYMTEFERGTGFQTAWLIHNSLVEENVSMYLFWELIWDNDGLVALENPWTDMQWETEKGYYKNDMYYAMQHYSKFIEPGFVRVGTDGSSNKIKVSSFISPAKDELVIVAINTLILEKEVEFNIPGTTNSETEVYKTMFVEEQDKFNNIGSLDENNIVSIPARSIITIKIKGSF